MAAHLLFDDAVQHCGALDITVMYIRQQPRAARRMPGRVDSLGVLDATRVVAGTRPRLRHRRLARQARDQEPLDGRRGGSAR